MSDGGGWVELDTKLTKSIRHERNTRLINEDVDVHILRATPHAGYTERKRTANRMGKPASDSLSAIARAASAAVRRALKAACSEGAPAR